MITIRPADLSEVDELTALCFRSKAIWGYDADFMEACREALTISLQDLASSSVQVAEQEGQVIAVAQVILKEGVASLDKLFVDPDLLRTGAGRTLFEWAQEHARQSGAGTLLIEADPDAAEFYRRMGAIDDGSVASESVPGRLIPRLKVEFAG